jgi:hypothetical protein
LALVVPVPVPVLVLVLEGKEDEVPVVGCRI